VPVTASDQDVLYVGLVGLLKAERDDDDVLALMQEGASNSLVSAVITYIHAVNYRPFVIVINIYDCKDSVDVNSV